MPHISLDDVAGGYNLSAINSNFQKIEDHINDKVLNRSNPSLSPNTVATDIDMNGNRIYNLPAPVSLSEPARLVDLQNVVNGGALVTPTNLATLITATDVTVTSDTGTDALIPSASTSLAGVMTPVMVTKLNGIAAGATVNDTDANLKNRANHTGSQVSSTISDFNEAVDDRVAGLLVAGTNITLSYNDAANTLTINSTASGGGTGDVVGPASSVTNNIATFSDTTGKLIKDSGKVAPAGVIVGTTDTQTLTSKTLTAPTINGGVVTGLTSFAIRNAGTGAFDMTIAYNGTLTAGRSLTWNLNDVARTVSLSGNLSFGGAFTTANAFTTSGAFAITLTATAATTVTLPTTGTLSTLAGTETLTNKTLTSPTLTGGTVDTFPIGYRNIPQTSSSLDYTAVLTDAGKHLLHPSADTTARTFIIPANASVAYPIGTALTFVNQNGAGSLTIAITTDTLRLAGAGTTGSRTLAANGIATALKVTSTEWIISGTGLT